MKRRGIGLQSLRGLQAVRLWYLFYEKQFLSFVYLRKILAAKIQIIRQQAETFGHIFLFRTIFGGKRAGIRIILLIFASLYFINE
jgi:hypothetical protein